MSATNLVYDKSKLNHRNPYKEPKNLSVTDKTTLGHIKEVEEGGEDY